MAFKAPSEGTKVFPGQNAPTKSEPAGTVPSESLAAESYREGGAFSRNTNAQPENLSYDQLKSSSGATEFGSASSSEARAAARDTTSTNAASYDEATGSGSFRANPKSYAGAAPTYVASQYAVDPKGPHGTNISEGFDDSGTQDGLQQALNAEPGSINDPARVAEQQMRLKNETKSRAAGPTERTFTNETKYDALNSDASA
ncbi:hypothetical protein ACO1O0_003579 [Amphichorda felina]